MAFRLTIKRRVMGLNAVIAVALSALLIIGVNYFSSRYSFRIDLSQSRFFKLTPITKSMLEHLTSDIHVIVFVGLSHDLYRDIRQLLKEYEYSSNHLRVEYVDPNRDLARAKELALKYDITEPGVVVFVSDGKRKIVPIKEIADDDYKPMMNGRQKKMTSFAGEQLFSSAIQSLMQEQTPVVYFLSGHGERQVDNYDQYSGYSIIARTLRRKNMNVRSFLLADVSAIPSDCSALIIAGPRRMLTRSEVDLINTYLDKSGRLFVLLDPGMKAGLGEMLAEWGVRIADDRVVDGKLTLTGRELMITEYGRHPITAHLSNITSIFQIPRSVQPVISTRPYEEKSADKPDVIVLASCSEHGWAEITMDQNPPTFDSSIDRPGPIPVAVAVEKGILSNMDVEIEPTRIVVIGDSAFVSNGALSAGHNPDFFLRAIDWLLERDDSLDIAVKEPVMLRVVGSREQIQSIYWMIVVVIPSCVAFLGAVVLFVRRK